MEDDFRQVGYIGLYNNNDELGTIVPAYINLSKVDPEQLKDGEQALIDKVTAWNEQILQLQIKKHKEKYNNYSQVKTK